VEELLYKIVVAKEAGKDGSSSDFFTEDDLVSIEKEEELERK
jgi:hypothetical protein